MLTCLRGPQGRLVLPIGSPSQNKEFTYLLTYLLLKGLVGWFMVKHPGQQFVSHDGTEPPLPGYLPVLLGA